MIDDILIIPEDEKPDLMHYGVKGMKWGVRRKRSAAKAARRDASSLRKHGYSKEADALDANARKLEKGAASGSSALKAARKRVSQALKANAEKRYASAIEKEKARTAAKKAKVKATKALIEKVIAEDRAAALKWGMKYDEAEHRAYWEKLFEKDLKED